MSNQNLLEVLKSNRIMRSRTEVLAFEQALATLALEPDINLLTELFTMFDDACEHPEVMWGLLHFIESFDMEVVIRVLVDVAPSLVQNAREWAETFHARILNSDSTRSYYRSLFPSLSMERRQVAHQILKSLAARSEELRLKVELVTQI